MILLRLCLELCGSPYSPVGSVVCSATVGDSVVAAAATQLLSRLPSLTLSRGAAVKLGGSIVVGE